MTISAEFLPHIEDLCDRISLTLERADALLVCIDVATTHPHSSPAPQTLSSAMQGVCGLMQPIKTCAEDIAVLIRG